MSKEGDKKFFTLFTIVVIALSILMIVFYFLGDKYGSNEKSPLTEATLTEPVIGAPTEVMQDAVPSDDGMDDTATAAAGSVDGKAVYENVCVACHAGAIPGIPKLGDKADWEPRIAQGNDVLYDHAINGFMGAAMLMPPKGGADISDEEVKAAVDYMVENSQ